MCLEQQILLRKKTKYVIQLLDLSTGFQHKTVEEDWTCHKCKNSREVDMIVITGLTGKEKIKCPEYLLL